MRAALLVLILTSSATAMAQDGPPPASDPPSVPSAPAVQPTPVQPASPAAVAEAGKPASPLTRVALAGSVVAVAGAGASLALALAGLAVSVASPLLLIGLISTGQDLELQASLTSLQGNLAVPFALGVVGLGLFLVSLLNMGATLGLVIGSGALAGLSGRE